MHDLPSRTRHCKRCTKSTRGHPYSPPLLSTQSHLDNETQARAFEIPVQPLTQTSQTRLAHRQGCSAHIRARYTDCIPTASSILQLLDHLDQCTAPQTDRKRRNCSDRWGKRILFVSCQQFGRRDTVHISTLPVRLMTLSTAHTLSLQNPNLGGIRLGI